MGHLRGRTALVTGGSKGIGLASGYALARAGATVALCARDAERLRKVAAEIRSDANADVFVVPADLGTVEGTQAAARDASGQLGQVDILVNVAGASPPGTIEQLTDEQWDIAIDLKLRGYIRLIRELLGGMTSRKFGRIINVAGNAGKQPDGWMVTSGIVNAGIMALTKAVGTTVAADGVTVNAVCPGPTDTDRWAGLQGAYARFHNVDEQEARDRLLNAIPAGRIAMPDEIADAILFFASDAAKHINGESLMVDGGHVKSV